MAAQAAVQQQAIDEELAAVTVALYCTHCRESQLEKTQIEKIMELINEAVRVNRDPAKLLIAYFLYQAGRSNNPAYKLLARYTTWLIGGPCRGKDLAWCLRYHFGLVRWAYNYLSNFRIRVRIPCNVRVSDFQQFYEMMVNSLRVSSFIDFVNKYVTVP